MSGWSWGFWGGRKRTVGGQGEDQDGEQGLRDAQAEDGGAGEFKGHGRGGC